MVVDQQLLFSELDGLAGQMDSDPFDIADTFSITSGVILIGSIDGDRETGPSGPVFFCLEKSYRCAAVERLLLDWVVSGRCVAA